MNIHAKIHLQIGNSYHGWMLYFFFIIVNSIAVVIVAKMKMKINCKLSQSNIRPIHQYWLFLLFDIWLFGAKINIKFI